MILILLGGPGSGKGTQARFLATQLDLDHISTGDILRRAIEDKTELGRMAKKYMDAGHLVPDEVILGMVREGLTNRNKCIIFDGFPRTAAQAEGLDGIIKDLGKSVTRAIHLDVDDDIKIERLAARRICRAHGHEYNLITRRPKLNGICDLCGSELYMRVDDDADVVRNRLKVYQDESKPVEEFYRSRGLLVEIDGNMHFNQVYNAIIETLAVAT